MCVLCDCRGRGADSVVSIVFRVPVLYPWLLLPVLSDGVLIGMQTSGNTRCAVRD